MEIAIIDENHDIIFASTSEMRLLFTYTCDLYMEVDYREVGDFMHIYDLYDRKGKPFVKIKKDELIKISKQWKEISKKSSKKILVKKEGEDFIFNELSYGKCKQEWEERRKIKLEDLSFEKSNIFNKTDKLFNGGHHCIAEEKPNKNYELINKYCDENCVITGDIKLAKDFTVNHAFFPETWTIDKIKKEIVQSLNSSLIYKYVEVEDKIFSFYGYAKEKTIIIQTLINNKGEVLTAYPIFRWMK